MYKIMLIDDDPSLQLALRHIVTDEGYAFCGATDGRQGLAMLDEEHPDLLLLDIMMPKMNGYEVCQEMRDQGRRIPVIFLSSKGDIVDKGMGFNAGADDYLVKPFDNEELLMRIEAHLRRYKSDLAAARARKAPPVIRAGDLEIDLAGHEVRKRGEVVELTNKEFQTLALLASHAGQAFTREQIYEHLWDEDCVVDGNSITVFIRRIREKIEDKASQPAYVLTVWGVGYKFAADFGSAR